MPMIGEDGVVDPAPGRKFGLYGFFYWWTEDSVATVAVFDKHFVKTKNVTPRMFAEVRALYSQAYKPRGLITCDYSDYSWMLLHIQKDYPEAEQKALFDKSIAKLFAYAKRHRD
jgi:hypothetical protein